MTAPVLTSVDAALHAVRAAGVGAGAHWSSDTRMLRPGDVFVAWPGTARDARAHLADAFARGAACALVEERGADAYMAGPRVLRVAGLQRLAGPLADAWYGHPSRGMTILAVTGTNGKTSCALWTAQALAAAGRPCGVVGTLGVGLPERLDPTGLTTPDPVRLHRELAAMCDAGVLHCAIEASSIGIAEQRLGGLRVHAAGFTNLTQDHLDYHGDMDAYAAVKRALFDWPALRAAVFNLDDAAGARWAREAARQGLQVIGAALDAEADWRADELADTAAGMRLRLRHGTRQAVLELPLVGRFNASNLSVVCGLLQACGLEFDAIVAALEAVAPPPGRMQLLGGRAAPLVVVDYAHTPDALRQVLAALRPLTARRAGRLWCVFGAGGDRDRGKRAPMAAAAEAGADRVVLTSDNPRSEAPQAVLDDLLQGLGAPANALVLAERADAIAQTVAHADAADVVLIAGKGHETTQEQQGRKTPFNDVFHARAALAARGGGLFDLRELRRWAGGRLHGDGAVAPAGVSTDTRTLRAGDLFVALRGERFDAAAMLPQAVAGGAAAVLAERAVAACGAPGIEVADARVALGELARAWRRQQPAMPLIAVTGSNGKTTVTQMLAAILAAWQGTERRLATQGNFNNEVGLPLTLLRLRPQHACGVVELGMNHPGEVARLAAIAEPTVALVNNAQREHQEFMQSVEAVARENGSALQALPAHGVAVFPATDTYAPLWAELAGGRARMRFALLDAPGAADAEVSGWLETPAEGAGLVLVLRTPQGEARVRLRLLGRHNAHNALAAAAAALAAGAPLAAVIDGLQAFEPVGGRMQPRALRKPDGAPLQLIDDTYNANPDSVGAAIDALAALPGRRLLVLGDMGEVGAQGEAFHAEAGARAARAGLDALWTVGRLARHAHDAAAGIACRHTEEAGDLPLAEAAAFDVVLVKGSRFMRMERVVAGLQERFGGAAQRQGANDAA